MPTIIDSLIVKLGLDSKDLDSKSGTAGRKLKDVEDQGKKTASSVKGIGAASKSTAAGVESLTRSLGGLLALIGGTMAIKRFITDQIESNAQLDRFSKNIGLSVSTVSAWGNAVEEMGGSAKGLQGTLDMLSKSQTELRLTGQSNLIPYFSALGVSLATVQGQARPVDEILLDLADRFSRMDRTTANNMGRMMGIDQDTLNLLLQGRREVELMIKRQREQNAVSKEQAAEASKLQRSMIDLKLSFTALGRNLLAEAAPALEKILALLTEFGGWVGANRQFVTEFLTVMAAGFTAIGIAALPINLTVAAITALAAGIVLLYQDYQTWKRGGESFIDWGKWEPGITAARNGIAALRSEIGKVTDAYKSWYEKTTGHKFSVGGFIGDTAAVLGIPLNQNKPASAGQSATGDQIKKFFMSQGWTAAQAAGIAANLMSESGGRTNATGDNGQAFGLAQWHRDRQAAFRAFAGHDIHSATLAEQLAFVQHELTSGSEKSAGKALRGATTAADAGAIVSRMYERPKDTEGEASRRGSLAASILGIKGASSVASAAGSGSAGSGNDNSVTTHIDKIEVVTQATDAAGIARDMRPAMDFLFTSQANTGLN